MTHRAVVNFGDKLVRLRDDIVQDLSVSPFALSRHSSHNVATVNKLFRQFHSLVIVGAFESNCAGKMPG
jgi:hypothetical protein